VFAPELIIPKLIIPKLIIPKLIIPKLIIPRLPPLSGPSGIGDLFKTLKTLKT
jgi:hypothetical protein